MDELQGLRVLREIVESGSFTAAGARLGMSAPMVSKHVARLERKLGVRLLNRSSRQLSLTEAGTLYHAQARQALDMLDAAAAAVGEAAAVPRGELKVSAPVWCATARFAQVLADYSQRYPEVRLDMHLENRMVDLVSDGFDVALRATATPSPTLIARPLCTVPFHLVATPGYLQNQPAGASVFKLIQPNYLPLDRANLLRQGEQPGLRLEVGMKSSDTTLSHHAVLAGMGTAFLPEWLVGDDLAAGRLVRVDRAGSGRGLQVPLFAVYTSRQYMPPKLRSFIDFLAERLAEGSPQA